MKKLFSLLFIPFLLTSCFSLEKKTTKMDIEIYMISPSENISRYYLHGIKGSHLKRRIIIIDDNGKYSIGDKFHLFLEQ